MEQQRDVILEHLATVSRERGRRVASLQLGYRTNAIKEWQQARFAATYADLLSTERYRQAAEFFLSDIYGPQDFAERDQQLVRLIPALTKLFHRDVVQTIVHLAELHALSETLDSSMAQALTHQAITADVYAKAWRQVGRAADRNRQIVLMMLVCQSLEQLTNKLMLRNTLRLMRKPAQAAGLTALQDFLERGFDAFRKMQGSTEFLNLIRTRENTLAAHLFGGSDSTSPPQL